MKYGATFILLSALLVFAWTTLAQSGDYTLTWWTVDSGGGESSGGGYTLAGIVGQPDAGVVLSGGGYSLIGGFWPGPSSGSGSGGEKVYLPVILRNH